MIWIIYIDNGQKYEDYEQRAVFACVTEPEAKEACALWEAWQRNIVIPEDCKGRSLAAEERRNVWVKENPPPFGETRFSYDPLDYSVDYQSVPTWDEVKP
jgi:hypothetical protein